MTDDRLSIDEIFNMFGGSIPAEALAIIAAPPEGRTIAQFRKDLQAIADQLSKARKAVTRFATVTSDGWAVTVTFHDGKTCPAVPSDDPHYYVIAHRCGYGDDRAAYCFEHEVAHLIVSEFFWGLPSVVLRGVAEGKPLSGASAATEELMAQTLQRYVRAKEEPIIGGVKWGELRAKFLAALGEENA